MADLKESLLFKSIREQSRHWYYSTKIYYLKNLLDKYVHKTAEPVSISDWGAGNGIIGLSLFGFLDISNESSLDLIDTGYERDVVCDGLSRHSYIRRPDPSKKYNILLAIDVVEHINDDKRFLELLDRHMEKGSLLIVAAPALDILWSNHDVYLEHYRRYNLHSLEQICASSKLRILESGYLFTVTLPIILFVRLFRRICCPQRNYSDMSIPPPAINLILRLMLRLECLFKLNSKWFATLPGSTVFVVAEKHD